VCGYVRCDGGSTRITVSNTKREIWMTISFVYSKEKHMRDAVYNGATERYDLDI